jgi:hypothetical protein
MINFSKQQLDKMLKLNEEFMLASPDRRKEIEQEMIAMVPQEQYAGSSQITELAKLQSELKDKITALGESASKQDVTGFFSQIQDLDNRIYLEAQKLGVELKKTDYGTVMSKVLEAKFGK